MLLLATRSLQFFSENRKFEIKEPLDIHKEYGIMKKPLVQNNKTVIGIYIQIYENSESIYIK